MNNPIARGGVKVPLRTLILRSQQCTCLFSIEPQLVQTPDKKRKEKEKNRENVGFLDCANNGDHTTKAY